jgi:hypothetical protein
MPLFFLASVVKSRGAVLSLPLNGPFPYRLRHGSLRSSASILPFPSQRFLPHCIPSNYNAANNQPICQAPHLEFNTGAA